MERRSQNIFPVVFSEGVLNFDLNQTARSLTSDIRRQACDKKLTHIFPIRNFYKVNDKQRELNTNKCPLVHFHCHIESY